PAAPKPFYFSHDSDCGLLAYSRHNANELAALALVHRERTHGWNMASQALNFPAIEAIPLTRSWAPGRRYRFTVRTRPVTRISHARQRNLPRECDVFLHAVASKSKEDEIWLDRQAVYLTWFREQVSASAANLQEVGISAMTRTKVYRRGAPLL